MRRKPLEIKMSSLDKNAPPGVEIVYRLTGRSEGPRRPPPVIADYTSAEEAQKHSDKLTAAGEWHEFLTWWRRDGRRLNKWATMLSGKRRYFKVSVPFVAGISDEMIRVLLVQAVTTLPDKPKEYTVDTVKITVDADSNRTELGGVALRLPPELAERARKMEPEQLTALVTQALESQP